MNYYLPQYRLLFNKMEKRFGAELRKISEIADVVCGPFGSAIKNTDYQEMGIPLIRITNISKEGYMDYDDLIYVSEELGNSLARTQVSEGDIVISQRGSLGQCAVVDDIFKKMNISANIIAIKNICGVSSEFLHDYLLSVVGQTLLERSVSGQVQRKITTQDIADLPVPIKCNEKRLVKIVNDAYASRTHKHEKANKVLNGMNTYISSVLNIPSIVYKENHCCGVQLSNVIEDMTFSADYYHPERMAAIHTLRECRWLPVLKLSDLVDFCREIVNSSECSKQYLGLASVESQTGELSGVEEIAAGQAFSYRKNDILYGRLRPYLNKVLLAEQDGICSTEFHVMRVLDSTRILPEYLANIMRSDLILYQTRHMMTGNTHPRISNEDVKNLYIPVPELLIQKKMVDELHQQRIKARKLRQEADNEWQEAKVHFEKELLGE